MPTAFTIRAIFDSPKDVFRDVYISKEATLLDLHHWLIKAFELSPGEMASFYRSDDEWQQLEEIPLEDMGDGVHMASSQIHFLLSKKNARALWVYDFMAMNTFYLEVLKIEDVEEIKSKITFRYGEMPEAGSTESNDFELDEEDFDDSMWNSDDLDEGFGEDFDPEERA